MEVSLDGKVFAGVQNSADGEVSSATRFIYHQDGSVIWAEYSGGDVLRGYLVGTRVGDRLSFRYVHLNSAEQTASGVCESEIEELPDGRLRLHETWTWESRPGSGESVIEEVGSQPR